ncbi:hypothetical protein RvY_18859 [Ramazzottius varieornatus]|uniref:ASX DEUBAD domain-containing protein n=1 Tax=Ramazzottius varieornatus TaxID=947166 RepID=A0A1D1W7B1_RAMVA|nr:hypothetical protein RvY_18859 [Ramazzottius varieornatus]
MISEDGGDDLPSDCDLISDDGEKDKRLAGEEMADDEERGEQVAESGSEYFTITDTVDVEEVVAHLSRERLSAPHKDGSLVEESGRHSDQEMGQLVMEGQKTDCRCGLLYWVEKGRVGFGPFQGFRRLTGSGHSSLSLSPDADEEEDDSLQAVADRSVYEGLLIHLDQPDEISLSSPTADHTHNGQPEEWPQLDEKGDGQHVFAMPEKLPPGAEVEAADEMEEEAVLLANEGDSGKGLLPERMGQQTLTALDEESLGRERVWQWEVVVDEAPLPDAAAGEGPAATVGQLVNTVTGHDVPESREQSSDSASRCRPLADGMMIDTDNAKEDTCPPPSLSHFAQVAAQLSTSSAGEAQATLLPPPQVIQPTEGFVAQKASIEEEVALVARMETCAALEVLKEQDINGGKKGQSGKEELKKEGKKVGALQKRPKGPRRKGPAAKKAKRSSSRSPSPEIPLPKAAPLSAKMAHQSPPPPGAAVNLVGKNVAAVQGQHRTVALAVTKAQPKKVVIKAIHKADVDAFVKDNRADLVTHHSLLGHQELFYDKKNKAKLDFRKQVLDKMPQQILYEILALMPKKCLETDGKGLTRLKVGMFSAEDAKFRAALQLYQSRVRTGQYDTEVRRAYVQYALSTVDPWKLKNFEPVYGMVMDPSYVTGTLHHLLQAKAAQMAEESQVREGENTETTKPHKSPLYALSLQSAQFSG